MADGEYSVRERSPYKEAFDTTILTKPKRFRKMATQWGALLAHAHARSDRHFDPDYVPYAFAKQVREVTRGRHREFRELVRDVAMEYTDLVIRDWEQFVTNQQP